LFEEHRFLKLKYLFLGVFDGIRDKYGNDRFS